MNSIDKSFADPRVTKEGCPSDDTLKEILSETNTLDPEVAQHIDTCAECLQRMEEFSGSTALGEFRSYAVVALTADDLEPPLREGDLGAVGELAIEAKIGQGGMGVVFQAHDTKLDREVAVKLLRTDASIASDARFEREARAAAKLTHHNTVPVYEYGRTAKGRPYIVMPLVSGESLKETIERAVSLSPRESADLVRQVALGLAAAHAEGLIHRDVKPGNILLDEDTGDARLTDFGLVRHETDETLTRAHAVCGTPAYMSPEQIENAIATGKRGDIYSLGIVLYECLTGSPPFRGMTMEVLDQHRNDQPVAPRKLNATVPLPLQNICLKAIAKEPERRYQSAADFAADLQRFLNDEPVVAKEASTWTKLRLWTKRNRSAAIWGSVSMLLLLTLAVVSMVAAFRLAQANRDIVFESDRATEAEEKAIQDRSAAVDSLEELVETLYADLSRNAATIKTREKVIDAALDGLQSLTHLSGDQRADRTIFRAHLRMGDLCVLRADHQQAEQHYQQAIRVSDSLLAEEPVRLQFLNDRGLVKLKLAQLYFRTQDEKLAEVTDETTQILDQITSLYPADEQERKHRLTLAALQLEMDRQKFPREPKRLLDQAGAVEETLREVNKLSGDDEWVVETAQKIHFVIGRAWLESHNPKKANEYFEMSEKDVDRLLEFAPDNLQYQNAAASLYRARGMAIGALGRLSEATPYLEQAVEKMGDICRVDPDNQMVRMNLANTQTILAMARQYSGDGNEAIRLREEAGEYYQEMLESNPANHALRSLLNLNRFEMVGLYFSEADYTGAEQVLQAIEGDLNNPQFAESGLPQVGMLRAQYRTRNEMLNHVQGQPVEEASVQGKCEALFFVLREFAKEAIDGRLPPEFQERIQKIEPEIEGETVNDVLDYCLANLSAWFNGKAAVLLSKARFNGLIARNIAMADEPKLKEFLEQARTQSIEAIESLVTIMRKQITDVIMNEADLIWLREQDEFKTAWQEIIGESK